VLRILKSKHVPSVLKDHVLEPAACAKARNVMLAGVADDAEGSRQVLYGLPGATQRA
jgi:hypothetical protein